MSTPSQIAANTINAQSSTGPRTETGKATSSKNGIKDGLFAAGDSIRPADQSGYRQLNAELLTELVPVGLLERNLVNEICQAMWRLHRCGEVEARLILTLADDPMETDDSRAEKTQRSIDRARAQAHRLLHKCTVELRRLQTERHCAREVFVEGADLSRIGIADWRAISKTHNQRSRSELRHQRGGEEASAISAVTNQTQSEAKQAA